MDSHLVKPFTIDSLLDAIARSISAVHSPVPASEATGGAWDGAATDPPEEAEFPDFDLETFLRISSMVSPESMDGHLRKLSANIEALRSVISEADFRAQRMQKLLADVHFLGGSAGMFGLERLANVCKHFERAAGLDTREAPLRAEGCTKHSWPHAQPWRTI